MSCSFGCLLVTGILAIQVPLSESDEPLGQTSPGKPAKRKNPFAPSERIRSLQKPAESEPQKEPETPQPQNLPMLIQGLAVDQNGKAVALLEVDGKVHFIRTGSTIASTAGSIHVESVSDQSVKVLIGSQRDPRTVRFPSASNPASGKIQ